MTTAINRRTWIHIASAQAAGLLVPGTSAESAVVFETDPFKLGVASGHPTENSVVLWTRLVPVNPLRNPWDGMAVPVIWEIATDETFNTIVQRGQTLAPSELMHSVHIEVQNLQSETVYYYRFFAGNFSSQVGRTRTFPAPNSANSHLRFAFASCQRYHEGNFTAYVHMLADKPDVVVFLGDYIYEMGATTQEKRGTWLYPVRHLEDYRLLYDLAHSDAALRDMRAACPWIVTWDDHEVVNDYAGADVRAGKEGGRVARLLPLGYQAWYENMPVSPRALVGGETGLLKGTTEVKIYEKYAWGKLADLHLLDNRQYRSKQISCGLAGAFDPKDCKDLDDPQRSMLGATQEKWLLENLARSSTSNPNSVTWNCILQPLVFSQFLIPVLGGRPNSDNWDGYPVSRQRIIETCKKHDTRNPVIFGGDIHQNWAAHITERPVDTQSAVVMPEFVCTSISTLSFTSLTAKEFKDIAPHCVYTDRHLRGYGLVDITPQRMQVDFRVVDNIYIPNSKVSTAARFEVKAGKPVMQKMDLV